MIIIILFVYSFFSLVIIIFSNHFQCNGGLGQNEIVENLVPRYNYICLYVDHPCMQLINQSVGASCPMRPSIGVWKKSHKSGGHLIQIHF